MEVPDKAWVTYITYIDTLKRFAYLAIVIDRYSLWVVGWSKMIKYTHLLLIPHELSRRMVGAEQLSQRLSALELGPVQISHSQ